MTDKVNPNPIRLQHGKIKVGTVRTTNGNRIVNFPHIPFRHQRIDFSTNQFPLMDAGEEYDENSPNYFYCELGDEDQLIRFYLILQMKKDYIKGFQEGKGIKSLGVPALKLLLTALVNLDNE